MIRLDGQVAVITGSGRGIGREYALLLAERGASVVVNDIGADVHGAGADASVADDVVAEIRVAGGRAVADTADIATEAGGAALIEHARAEFGRVDICIHNAGSLHRDRFEDFPVPAAARLISTHLLGAFHVGQPAWRVMLDQGYGRVLLTTSVALFGAPNLTAYSAAKAGVVGLTRALALEAAASGADIKVNAISPTAATRRARASHGADPAAAAVDDGFGEAMDPRAVAIVALPLVAPGCPCNGECVKAGGGVVAGIRTAMTNGWVPDPGTATPEGIAAHLVAELADPQPTWPHSSADARALLLDRLERSRPSEIPEEPPCEPTT